MLLPILVVEVEVAVEAEVMMVVMVVHARGVGSYYHLQAVVNEGDGETE